MKTTTRRHFLTSALLGLACLALAGFTAHAQSPAEIEARSAGKLKAEFVNLRIIPQVAHPGETITVKARLMYRKKTGSRPSDWVHEPVRNKPVEFKLWYAQTKGQYPGEARTDGSGWATWQHTVPTDVLKNRPFVTGYVVAKFDGDRLYTGDTIKDDFKVTK